MAELEQHHLFLVHPHIILVVEAEALTAVRLVLAG
jgi:hypothetical protein